LAQGIALPLTTSAQREENLAIARGLKQRDVELLDTLILTYQHRLFRYLLYLTGSRELAEDLFQETWMRVLERGSQYHGAARFDTWLFTIARNLVIDVRRKRTMASLEELCDTMVNGSLCGLGGMTPYPVQSALKYFREDFVRP